MVEWFKLVRKRHELVREESALIYASVYFIVSIRTSYDCIVQGIVKRGNYIQVHSHLAQDIFSFSGHWPAVAVKFALLTPLI